MIESVFDIKLILLEEVESSPPQGCKNWILFHMKNIFKKLVNENFIFKNEFRFKIETWNNKNVKHEARSDVDMSIRDAMTFNPKEKQNSWRDLVLERKTRTILKEPIRSIVDKSQSMKQQHSVFVYLYEDFQPLIYRP